MTGKNQKHSYRQEVGGGYDTNSFIRLVGDALDASGDCGAYENDRFLAWLEREVHGRSSAADRESSERAAQQIAKRAQARIRASRVAAALPERPFRARAAALMGNFNHVARAASESGCAPWVESLAVAAGTGREIWDEPCEQWVELPTGFAGAGNLALTVTGDSMTPCLESGDVILVNTRKPVTRDCMVVARRAEDGYVVKHVTRCGRAELELSSFNNAYEPFVIERAPGTVVGVVIAKLVRDGGVS
jgi:SOS-response transcriptional repressor LexA